MNHDHNSYHKPVSKKIEMDRNSTIKFSIAIYDFTGQQPDVSLYLAQCILFLSLAFLPEF